LTFLEDVPIIPRRVLFDNPDKASPRLSPDGSRLAYIAPVDGVMNVWVGPAAEPASAVPVTSDTARGIRIFFWAYTNEHIIYLQDKGGDENWRVYSVDLTVGTTIDLTPFDGVQAQIQEVSHRIPQEMLVGLNNRVPQLHDLYRVNVATGEYHLILENEDFAAFVTDDDFNVRFGLRLTSDGGSEALAPDGDGGWKSFMVVGREDMLTTQPLGFDKAGRTLYMTDSRNRNTAGLVSVDLETGEETIIAENARADMSDVMMHPTENTIQAVTFTYQRKQWMVLEGSVDDDIKYLNTVEDGDIDVVSRTLDDTTWVVEYEKDDGPIRYYLYERATKTASFLFSNRVDLDGQPLVKMNSVVIKSRDDLDLVSYYSLPLGSDSADDGKPDQPLPTVLFVHGGPWSRDDWGYNSFHQLLANRGYAVLSVNF
jgi:dipeptidyl aminopeptidase/acylaminoacyl peptidase